MGLLKQEFRGERAVRCLEQDGYDDGILAWFRGV